MSNLELKAKDYRRLFEELTGFPLKKCNAVKIIPDIGDLRKVNNLRLVYEAAVTQKTQNQEHKAIADLRSQLMEKENIITDMEVLLANRNDVIASLKAEMEMRLTEKDNAITQLKTEMFAQRLRQEKEFSSVKDTKFTSVDFQVDAIALVCVEVPELVVEKILTAILPNDEDRLKSLYRKLVFALHPDTTKLQKKKAGRCLDILNGIYQQISQKCNATTFVKPTEQKNEQFVSPEELWDDIKDL